jgi:hypothetical protein
LYFLRQKIKPLSILLRGFFFYEEVGLNAKRGILTKGQNGTVTFFLTKANYKFKIKKYQDREDHGKTAVPLF